MTAEYPLIIALAVFVCFAHFRIDWLQSELRELKQQKGRATN